MSAPSLRNITQTSQREFAAAKLVINFDLCKYIRKNLIFLQILIQREGQRIFMHKKICT